MTNLLNFEIVLTHKNLNELLTSDSIDTDHILKLSQELDKLILKYKGINLLIPAISY